MLIAVAQANRHKRPASKTSLRSCCSKTQPSTRNMKATHRRIAARCVEWDKCRKDGPKQNCTVVYQTPRGPPVRLLRPSEDRTSQLSFPLVGVSNDSFRRQPARPGEREAH